MTRPKTTTEKAREHEEWVADLFDGRRSKSSGAQWNDDTDVVTEDLVIECEYTEAKSYRLTLDFWSEVQGKIKGGRLPALAIRFRNPYQARHVDLAVISIHDLSSLLLLKEGNHE